MNKSINIRAYEKDGIVTVKSIIRHPMESGLRKNNKTGKKYPANYIQEVIVQSANKTVMEAYWGGAISRNPYFSFRFKGKSGNDLIFSWTDNKGRSEFETIRIL
ncbi:MAG: sulfur-oxidizing protein SoxZ [Candidatus Azotimanducaceae bacterium]|jgi:sulfur-oxidizing protein SoxZ